MAIFTDKIVTASFLDYPQNTLVEVIYKEGDQNTSYVMEVDFTQENFSDLMKEITLDEIESQTKAQVEKEGEFFTKAIEQEIQRRWSLENEKIQEMNKEFNRESKSEKITGGRVIDLLHSDDSDFIFSLKIAILEDSDIATSKDKALKMQIRKAKSALELLRIYCERKLEQKD